MTVMTWVWCKKPLICLATSEIIPIFLYLFRNIAVTYLYTESSCENRKKKKNVSLFFAIKSYFIWMMQFRMLQIQHVTNVLHIEFTTITYFQLFTQVSNIIIWEDNCCKLKSLQYNLCIHKPVRWQSDYQPSITSQYHQPVSPKHIY